MNKVPFICPICQEQLEKVNKNYICSNKHLYNIAKEGYVNLLINSKMSGDNKEMLIARSNILNSGIFNNLVDKIINIIGKLNINNILDVGCGEGFYDRKILKFYPNIKCVGIDISKEACKMASKKTNMIDYAVASVTNLPFKNNSFDLILNIFAPHNEIEFPRICNQYILKITPGREHLLELKEILYDDVYLNQEKIYSFPTFSSIYEEEIKYQTIVNDVKSLFQMTPYYYKTNPIKRNIDFNKMNITMDFNLILYKKNKI